MLIQLDHVVAFTIAASFLTIVPGMDTALVLRTAASEGSWRAVLTGCGIALGCMAWGFVVAIGLGALIATSKLCYTVLRWVGAAYLLYLGCRLIVMPRRSFSERSADDVSADGRRWLLRGMLTNLLNPKVGVFYVSFLPQFIPLNVNVPATVVLLTTIHGLLGLLWFGILIVGIRPIGRLIRKTAFVTWLDRLTGGMFVIFGLRLAASSSS